MTRPQINFRLDSDESLARLRHEAEERGLSLSEYVRTIVEGRRVCPTCGGSGRVADERAGEG